MLLCRLQMNRQRYSIPSIVWDSFRMWIGTHYVSRVICLSFNMGAEPSAADTSYPWNKGYIPPQQQAPLYWESIHQCSILPVLSFGRAVGCHHRKHMNFTTKSSPLTCLMMCANSFAMSADLIASSLAFCMHFAAMYWHLRLRLSLSLPTWRNVLQHPSLELCI